MKKRLVTIVALILVAVMACLLVACDTTETPCTALCEKCGKCTNAACTEHTEKCTCEEKPACTALCELCQKCTNTDCIEHADKCLGHGAYDSTKTPSQNLSDIISAEGALDNAADFVINLSDAELVIGTLTAKFGLIEIAASESGVNLCIDKLTVTVTIADDSVRTLEMLVKAVISDGIIDAVITSTQNGEDAQVVIKVSVSELVAKISEALKESVPQETIQQITSLIQMLGGLDGLDMADVGECLSVAEKFILDVAFDSATNRYTVTFNPTKLNALNEDLATLTVDKFVDKYFGAGSWLAFKTALPAVNTITVGDILTALSSSGISLDAVCEMVSSVSEEIGLGDLTAEQVKAMIESVKTQTVVSLLCSLIGNESLTPSAVAAFVSMVPILCESQSVYGVICTVYGMFATEPTDDVAFDAAAATVAIKNAVANAIAALSKIQAGVTIDTAGKLVSAHLNLAKVEFAIPNDDGTTTAGSATFKASVAFQDGVAKGDYTGVSDTVDQLAKASDVHSKLEEVVKGETNNTIVTYVEANNSYCYWAESINSECVTVDGFKYKVEASTKEVIQLLNAYPIIMVNGKAPQTMTIAVTMGTAVQSTTTYTVTLVGTDSETVVEDATICKKVIEAYLQTQPSLAALSNIRFATIQIVTVGNEYDLYFLSM